MKWQKFIFSLVLFSICTLTHGHSLSQEDALLLAEKFVAENGYTNTSTSVKEKLDFESFEFSSHRDELLKFRKNSLRPKAIGVKRGGRTDKDGWSVAFDYENSILRSRDICRIVTMAPDGSKIVMQHVEGIRSYFVSPN
jgi:hypothetical protein